MGNLICEDVKVLDVFEDMSTCFVVPRPPDEMGPENKEAQDY